MTRLPWRSGGGGDDIYNQTINDDVEKEKKKKYFAEIFEKAMDVFLQ